MFRGCTEGCRGRHCRGQLKPTGSFRGSGQDLFSFSSYGDVDLQGYPNDGLSTRSMKS